MLTAFFALAILGVGLGLHSFFSGKEGKPPPMVSPSIRNVQPGNPFPAVKSSSVSGLTKQTEPEPLLLPTGWPRAKLLLANEKEMPGNGKKYLWRQFVVQPVDLPYPVLIEEKVLRDAGPVAEKTVARREMAANHLLIKMNPDFDGGNLSRLTGNLGASLRPHPSGQNLFFMELPDIDPEKLHLALDKLKKMPEAVAYAEPDYVVHAYTTFPDDDPRFDEQWGLHNIGQSGGKPDADMDAPEGWDIRHDASNVIVAVIDTGARYTHQDLQANMWENTVERDGLQGVDDDGNDYIDDIFGINAITGSGDPLDDDVVGHGTHVSGTIGAVGNNGVGVTGVAWDVQIMALKFLDSEGSGFVSGAIECINYAIAMEADILSNSWGGSGFSQSLDDAIGRAQAEGIIFVAAAGNDAVPGTDGADNDNIPSYPTSYTRDNIVSVTSMTRNDGLSTFSNFGESSVDIAAPGSSILSLGNGSDSAYATLSGTSMACPHVSGLLAVLMAQFQGEDYITLIDRLYGGAEAVSVYQGKTRTGRRANLAGSLSLGTVLRYPEITRGIGNPIVGEGSPVTLSVQAEGGGVLTYRWLKDGVTISGQTGSSLVLSNVGPSDAGQYQVIVGNAAGETTNTGDLEIGITNPAYSAAVDGGGLSFITSGDANWFVDSGTGRGHLDDDSLASGTIGDEEQSRLQSTVKGPGIINFWWKISSEANFDFLLFFIGGQLIDFISGEEDWKEVMVEIPAGTQTLEWNYSKDFLLFDEEDRGWVDDVQYVSANIEEPFIFNHPVSVSLLEGDALNLLVESFGNATLQFQWEKDQTPIDGETGATLFIASVTKSNAGRYRVVVSNDFGMDTSLEAVVDVFGDDPIGEALDYSEQNWNEAGSAFWFPQSIVQHDGVDALQSGHLDDLELSEFSFSVTGPVDLAFWWKSSTETYYDFLTIAIDNDPQAAIAGNRDWHRQLLRVPGGSHNVRWIYEKDFSVFGHEDAVWVDELQIVDVDAIYNGALENGSINLVWSLEETSWFVQSTFTNDGQDALQSGPTTRSSHSAIQTTVSGPATVSFWWKVSSEAFFDLLKFYLNEGELERALLLTINGEQDWSQRIINLDAGTHTLKWSYEKDFLYNIGEDAGWLDQLVIVYPTTIEDWRALVFSSTDLADGGKEATLWGDRADPDHDFLPNLVEAFMGLDPNVRDLVGENTFNLSADTEFLRFVYQRMKTAPGITGVVEWSVDGVNWSETGVIEEILQDLPAMEIVEARIPIGTNTNLMARLRVSR